RGRSNAPPPPPAFARGAAGKVVGLPPGNGGPQMLLQIDRDRIRAVLDYRTLIPAMERALAEFSTGKVIQPVRTMLVLEEGKRYLGIMPAVASNAMGAKLVSFYPGNEGTPVPTHMAEIMLFRPDTGEPLATLDG